MTLDIIVTIAGIITLVAGRIVFVIARKNSSMPDYPGGPQAGMSIGLATMVVGSLLTIVFGAMALSGWSHDGSSHSDHSHHSPIEAVFDDLFD